MANDDGDNLRQAVFGANDGLVSTFGLVAGLVGAAVSQHILLLANIINMLAAGMSMGFGTYLATKSQVDFYRCILCEEQEVIRTNKAYAKKELALLLSKRGVAKKDLAKHVATIVDDEKEWLSFVLAEKHGLGKASFPNPIKGGAIMFLVFIGCGLIPIIPLFFVIGFPALIASAILTGTGLFIVGAMKQQFVRKQWWRLGLENLLIGAITGVVGFFAGVYTGHLIGTFVG